MSSLSCSLETTIDAFLRQLGHFTKDVKENVAQLQRSLENGYSLTPQELRERLKHIEKQTNEIRDETEEIESGTFGESSLAELTYRYATLFQETNDGIHKLEAHLENYGYHHEQSFQDYAKYTPRVEKPISREINNLSPTSFQGWVKEDRRTIATLSESSTLPYSPGTVDLQKKYNTMEPTPNEVEMDVDIDDDEGDINAEDDNRGDEKVQEIFRVQEVHRSVTPSPRLSFEAPSLSFGSPFRSPHNKAECSFLIQSTPPLPSPVPSFHPPSISGQKARASGTSFSKLHSVSDQEN